MTNARRKLKAPLVGSIPLALGFGMVEGSLDFLLHIAHTAVS